MKKVFLEISQNSQKNTFTSVSFLIKLHALGKTRCSVKKMFLLKFCKTHRKTPMPGSLFDSRVGTLGLQLY